MATSLSALKEAPFVLVITKEAATVPISQHSSFVDTKAEEFKSLFRSTFFLMNWHHLLLCDGWDDTRLQTGSNMSLHHIFRQAGQARPRLKTV